MIAAAIAFNLIALPVLVRWAWRRFAGWPEPRAHHVQCPSCMCSYASPAGLARHYQAQHTDDGARWPVVRSST